jgi:regulator of replication initiation timing
MIFKEEYKMSNLSKRIELCKAEIELLKNEVRELREQKHWYMYDRSKMRKDLLNYRYPDLAIERMIRDTQHEIEVCNKKLDRLYEERTWLGVEYFGPKDLHDIEDIIGRDGFIVGIKL